MLQRRMGPVMGPRFNRRTRRAAAVVVAVVAAAVWSAAPAAPAHADTTLIGWTSQADANAFDFVIDNSAGLSGVHPLAEADVPEDNADFETGPFGHGLASVVWPGGTAGNLGSLSGQLGLPAQLAPLVSQANDPVRAETFYPAGPTDASYPAGSSSGAAEMKSHAGSDGTTASSGLSDLSVSGLFDLQGVQGSSTTGVSSVASATATGSFSALSLLGGMITVGATTSSATATSDGTSPTGQATTHIGAIVIDGHQVSVGTDGITVGPAATNAANALLAPSVQQVNQLIQAFNISMTPLPQTETRQAPAESITSGGLRISLKLPPEASVNVNCSSVIPSQASQLDVLCTLPGLLQGASLTMTIGRSTATAIATPPFPVDLSGAPPSDSGTSATGVSGDTSTTDLGAGVAAAAGQSLPPDASAGLAAGPGTPSLAGAPTASQPSPAAPAPQGVLGALTPVDVSRPVKAGLLVFLLLVAGAASAGLFRIGRRIGDAPPAGICPFDEENG